MNNKHIIKTFLFAFFGLCSFSLLAQNKSADMASIQVAKKNHITTAQLLNTSIDLKSKDWKFVSCSVNILKKGEKKIQQVFMYENSFNTLKSFLMPLTSGDRVYINDIKVKPSNSHEIFTNGIALMID